MRFENKLVERARFATRGHMKSGAADTPMDVYLVEIERGWTYERYA